MTDTILHRLVIGFLQPDIVNRLDHFVFGQIVNLFGFKLTDESALFGISLGLFQWISLIDEIVDEPSFYCIPDALRN